MLRDLSNDTRGAACRCHDVGERLERARSFAVGRRGFSVVEVLAAGAVLSVARESSLGLSDGVGCSGRRRLAKGRGSRECRRGVAVRVRCGVGMARAGRGEVKRRERRRMGRFGVGARSLLLVGRRRVVAGMAGGIAFVVRQRSDYGRAVGARWPCLRQGAGVGEARVGRRAGSGNRSRRLGSMQRRTLRRRGVSRWTAESRAFRADSSGGISADDNGGGRGLGRCSGAWSWVEWEWRCEVV